MHINPRGAAFHKAGDARLRATPGGADDQPRVRSDFQRKRPPVGSDQFISGAHRSTGGLAALLAAISRFGMVLSPSFMGRIF
jgi:hypothetical protein